MIYPAYGLLWIMNWLIVWLNYSTGVYWMAGLLIFAQGALTAAIWASWVARE